MKRVTKYEAIDGKLFDSWDDAKRYENDLIAEELEEIIAHITCLDCSHRVKVNGILAAIGPKKAQLKACIEKLHTYLSIPDLKDEDDD